MIDSWIFYAVPQEVGREILSFLNPLASPPHEELRRRRCYKKWCDDCGEFLTVSRNCGECGLPTRYTCLSCKVVSWLVSCPGPNNTYGEITNPDEVLILGHAGQFLNEYLEDY